MQNIETLFLELNKKYTLNIINILQNLSRSNILTLLHSEYLLEMIASRESYGRH